ncbi:hypothetical protein C8J57DRAFT_1226129 [Mycena rebaudengoi]|nr:hypothetical protein C8J57DRAFT_1226129 [Mycena rebaudengoi]
MSEVSSKISVLSYEDRIVAYFILLFPEQLRMKTSMSDDICSEIFQHYCLTDGPSVDNYVSRRRELSLKHPRWACFLAQQTTFWHKLMVYANTPLENVLFTISRVHRAPLDVEFLLDGADSEAPASTIVGLDNTRRCLEAAATKSHLWAVIRVIASNMHHARIALEILTVATVPALTSFYVVIPPAVYGIPTGSNHQPPRFFDLITPSMRSLYSYGVCFPWDALSCFARLTKLRLLHLPSRICPTADQFAAVLLASTALTQLTIAGQFDLCMIQRYSARDLKMESLVQLELDMSTWPCQTNVATLMSGLHLPRIQHISLSHLNDECRRMLTRGRFASTTPSLTLVGFDMFAPLLADFLHGFTRLRNLNMRSASAAHLSALMLDVHTCPELCDLTVGSVPLLPLSTYIIKRSRLRCPIVRLVLDYSYPVDTLTDSEIEALYANRDIDLPVFLASAVQHLCGVLFNLSASAALNAHLIFQRVYLEAHSALQRLRVMSPEPASVIQLTVRSMLAGAPQYTDAGFDPKGPIMLEASEIMRTTTLALGRLDYCLQLGLSDLLSRHVNRTRDYCSEIAKDTIRFLVAVSGVLLKDKRAANLWFATGRPACRHCVNRKSECVQQQNRPACGECTKRRVRCSQQEDFLYANSLQFFGGDRQVFEAHRAAHKVSRSRVKKENPMDVDTRSIREVLSRPFTTPIDPSRPINTVYVEEHTTTSPLDHEQLVAASFDDDGDSAMPDGLKDIDQVDHEHLCGMETTTETTSLPSVLTEYRSVGVQTTLQPMDPSLEFEGMDMASLRTLLKNYSSILLRLEGLAITNITNSAGSTISNTPDTRAIANATMIVSHRAHFEMTTALFAAQYRVQSPKPTHSRDVDILEHLFKQLQASLGLLAISLDWCRDADPLLFKLLDPTVPELSYDSKPQALSPQHTRSLSCDEAP